jgi:hypothetical protein
MHKVILCLDSTGQVISSKVAVNIPTIRNIIDIYSSNYLICGSGYLIKINQNILQFRKINIPTKSRV